MAWINEQAFFDRTLRNELVSLRALKQATMDLKTAKHRATGVVSDVTQAVSDIDAAIEATQKLIDGGSHHP